MLDNDVAREIADRLVKALKPIKVVWFGSRARGAGGPDSDYDFLVVARLDLPMGERLFRAQWAVRDITASKDILVVSPAEYERYSMWTSSVVFDANANGKVLYEAG